jgi:2-polyprenyl-6-hydroxyphenyl methylase/3-demethylubiquinone-9 3-methyltransferase
MYTRQPTGDNPHMPSTTVDPAEIEKFSRMAAEWWDPTGKFRPLHKFNPARLAYIRDAALAHFQRDGGARTPLAGLKVVDIGCGGGLVAEPMRRLGAAVTGIDASARNVEVARLHAAQMGLEIDYRAMSVEDLADAGDRFDLVLNLEAVEHAADPTLFIAKSAALLAPDGLFIVATISRTLKAFALAKVGAEYVLGWLPRGTHNPAKFVKPEELEAMLGGAGLAVTGRAGFSFDPLADRWRLSDDLAVNYMLTAIQS